MTQSPCGDPALSLPALGTGDAFCGYAFALLRSLRLELNITNSSDTLPWEQGC